MMSFLSGEEEDTSCFTTSLPTVPVAPVTKIVSGIILLSFLNIISQTIYFQQSAIWWKS
jgi:hypothetical protein